MPFCKEPKDHTWSSPFASYLDYIKAIHGSWPEYSELRSGLEHGKSSQPGRIQVQDIRLDGSYCDTAIFTHNEVAVVSRLKEKLADCSADIRTRIILIEYAPNQKYDPNYGSHKDIPLTEGLWAVVGLALDIEPLFFESSWNEGRILRLRKFPHRPEFLRMPYMTIKLLSNQSTATLRIPTGEWQISE